MQIELKTGFRKIIDGKEVYIKDVELKRLNYGEMLDVQEQSEKMVLSAAGTPMLIASETLMAKNSLIAQIKRIGTDYAPFKNDILDDLNEEDGNILMEASGRSSVAELAVDLGKA